MPLDEPGPELTLVAGLLDARLPWTGVAPTRLAVGWSEILEAQVRGEDPTAGWRAAVGAQMTRQHGVPAPARTPSAMVLQWCLEVPATLLTMVAVLGPWRVALEDVSFALDPVGLFPATFGLSAVAPAPGDVPARLRAAEVEYLTAAHRLAATYDSGVKTSSRQRTGMVDDMWAMAQDRARRAVLPPPHPDPGPRVSCCFLFALPGMRECQACPRQTTRP